MWLGSEQTSTDSVAQEIPLISGTRCVTKPAGLQRVTAPCPICLPHSSPLWDESIRGVAARSTSCAMVTLVSSYQTPIITQQSIEQLLNCGQVGSTIGRLQEDAKAIKNDLSALHSQQKSRQTSKILSDFEVGVSPCCCPLHPHHCAVSLLVTAAACSEISCLRVVPPGPVSGPFGILRCTANLRGIDLGAGSPQGLPGRHEGGKGEGGGQPAQAACGCPVAGSARTREGGGRGQCRAAGSSAGGLPQSQPIPMAPECTFHVWMSCTS